MRIREIVSARTVVQEMSGAEEPAELRGECACVFFLQGRVFADVACDTIDAPELSFCVATVKLLIECAGDAAHGALYTVSSCAVI